MATPIPGFPAGLPRVLQITIKLSQHREAIAPFLNSLPAPFEWLIETPAMATQFGDLVDQQLQEKHTAFMGVAEIAKAAGNRAFTAKDFPKAIEEYTKAIDRSWDAATTLPQKTEQWHAAQRLMAMCYANRAAVYLLPGEHRDVKKALHDCQNAEQKDPDYAKG